LVKPTPLGPGIIYFFLLFLDLSDDLLGTQFGTILPPFNFMPFALYPFQQAIIFSSSPS